MTDADSFARSSADPAPPARAAVQQQSATLFLISTLAVGGSEKKTMCVVNELHKRGRNVHLAYLHAPQTLLNSVQDGVPVVCLERKGKFSPAAIRALRTYIQEQKIERLCCVNLYPLIYAEVARALLPIGHRPTVNVLINTTEHASSKARLQMLIYRPLINRADKVIFGCRAQLELWRERYQLKVRRCEVIYNGVDTEWFSPRAMKASASIRDLLGISGTGVVIGSVGQLRPEKNHIELIRALARLKDRLPGARLVIVGEGPERPSLEAAARKYGLHHRVQLLGQLDDVRPMLGAMDIFVLPSITETFSNATLEAMAMAKAVIISDTGGSREMVENGKSGLIYSQGDADGLAGFVEHLAGDLELREKMGTCAREAVVERFSLASMIDEYDARCNLNHAR